MNNCDRCGLDDEDNDGPLNDCAECGLSLCDHCYGDRSFEWCESCRREEAERHSPKKNAHITGDSPVNVLVAKA